MTHPLAALIAGVKVKPLVWEAGERDQRRADSILGEFCVTFFGGRWFYQGEPCNGMLDAQAAAQADYEARILAALEAAPVPDLVAAAGPIAALIELAAERERRDHDESGPLYDFAESEVLTAARNALPALIALATAQAEQIAGLTKALEIKDANRRFIIDERDRTFSLMVERTEAAEAKVAELEAQIAGLTKERDQARKFRDFVLYKCSDAVKRAETAEAQAATLRAEVERLRGALEFYSCKDGCNDCSENERDLIGCGWTARAALEGKA